ncbi:MAG: response regulator transcription factor, partial [Gemmatimonadota bacterium]
SRCMSRILVIEDDAAILRGLKDNFVAEGYDVLVAEDGVEGYRLAREKDPDLIILDLMLPALSGYEICRKLRDNGDSVLILMLTARGEEADRILGLDLGADDYVTKPFSIRELKARVRALLRRSDAQSAPPDTLSFGDVVVDFPQYAARKGGEPVEMTPKEFGVLRYLAARPGEVVSRYELLEQVWGYGKFPTTRTVDNHIAALRAKLEEDPAEPRYLQTVHRVGYKFVP